MCFGLLCNFCLKHFSFLEQFWEIWSQMYIGRHVKCPLFYSDFNETYIFAADFRKTLKYQISWESVQWVPSCSIRTDGQTERTKLIIVFRNFTKAPKIALTSVIRPGECTTNDIKYWRDTVILCLASQFVPHPEVPWNFLQGQPFLMCNKTVEGPVANDECMGYSMDLLKEIANVLSNDSKSTAKVLDKFKFKLELFKKHDQLVNQLVTRVRFQLSPCCHCMHVTVITCWHALLVACCRRQTWPFVTWP